MICETYIREEALVRRCKSSSTTSTRASVSAAAADLFFHLLPSMNPITHFKPPTNLLFQEVLEMSGYRLSWEDVQQDRSESMLRISPLQNLDSKLRMKEMNIVTKYIEKNKT